MSDRDQEMMIYVLLVVSQAQASGPSFVTMIGALVCLVGLILATAGWKERAR